MSLGPGDVLSGKYRIERALGEGGMGVVMLATHLELDQPVALKFLLPQALEHPEVVERFAREAKAAAKIRGANAVKVLDVGRTDDGAPYMVMEYLEGRDLGSVLAIQGRIEPARAIDLVLEACEGLAEAHLAGIVHRDLKPSNLFLASTPDGGTVVKVLDFGISKLAEQKDLTRTNAMMGTAYYMSPEQLTTPKLVDARSDIWSLGVVLYVLLSGSQPFDADTLPEVIALILKNEPTPLGVLIESLPVGLGAVVHRCFASRPEARFRDLGEMAEALAPFGSDAATRSARRIARVLAGGAPGPSIDAASLDARGPAGDGLGATTVANPVTTKRSAEWNADAEATVQGAPPGPSTKASAVEAPSSPRTELSDHGAPAVAHTSVQPGPPSRAAARRGADEARGGVGGKLVAGVVLGAAIAGAIYVASAGPKPATPAEAASAANATGTATSGPAVTPADAPSAAPSAISSSGASAASAAVELAEPTATAAAATASAAARPPSTTAPRPPIPPGTATATTQRPTATSTGATAATAAPIPTNPLEMQLK